MGSVGGGRVQGIRRTYFIPQQRPAERGADPPQQARQSSL